MNHDDTLYELIDRIREHITRAEKQYVLLNDREKWLSLASAIYIIEDTSSAIEYYLSENFPSENSGKYLFIYGLLQACFLQQDAIRAISQALFERDIDYKENYPSAYSIRELRNRVAGHPISKKGGEYIQISQLSINKESFQYLISEVDQDKTRFINVNIIRVIKDMQRCAQDILKEIVEKLDLEESEFMEKYKAIKIANIFSQLSFAREKVLCDPLFKDAEYRHVKRMVKECEEELTRRYGTIEALDTYKNELDDIHALFDLIDNGLGEVRTDTVSQIEHWLFELLFVKLSDLAKLCTETDLIFSGEAPV
ncbi:MAG: hypothetical protein ABFC73_14410 [Clostridiaceae bacterium]